MLISTVLQCHNEITIVSILKYNRDLSIYGEKFHRNFRRLFRNFQWSCGKVLHIKQIKTLYVEERHPQQSWTIKNKTKKKTILSVNLIVHILKTHLISQFNSNRRQNYCNTFYFYSFAISFTSYMFLQLLQLMSHLLCNKFNLIWLVKSSGDITTNCTFDICIMNCMTKFMNPGRSGASI